MKDNLSLSIAIPTFNRFSELKNTIEILIPQLNENIEIVIVDNASDVDIKKYFTNNGLLKNNIKVFTNIINIGAAANIAKCFEMASKDFIWLLSDDDKPLYNSVETVTRSIKTYPDVEYYNFSAHWCKRKEDLKGQGISDFINTIDSYSNTVFMSTNVYNREKILKELYFGYTFSYSMAPHLAMMFMMINNSNSKFILLKDEIVNWNSPEAEGSWSEIRYQIAIKTLLELPLSIDNVEFKNLSKFLPNRNVYGAMFAIFFLASKNSEKESYYNNLFKQFIFRNKGINPYTVGIY